MSEMIEWAKARGERREARGERREALSICPAPAGPRLQSAVHSERNHKTSGKRRLSPTVMSPAHLV